MRFVPYVVGMVAAAFAALALVYTAVELGTVIKSVTERPIERFSEYCERMCEKNARGAAVPNHVLYNCDCFRAPGMR